MPRHDSRAGKEVVFMAPKESLGRALCAAALCLALAALCAVPALAEPQLADVLPDIDALAVENGDVLTITYTASDAGRLVASVHLENTDDEPLPLFAGEIAAGPGALKWDGAIGGAPVPSGAWVVSLSFTDAQGQRAVTQAVAVQVRGEGDRPAATPRVYRTPSPDRQLSAFRDPHERCFWQMDIDNLDVYDPEDQKIIWEILMQPVTVLDIHPTEHVYPLSAPDADPKDAQHYTGQLHGQSQGVHVLETLPNGLTHIEAFSNDGYKAPRQAIRSLTAQLISGYVRADLLKTINPDPTIGLVIDKLTQRLYVFQNGKLTGELLVSTGKPTKGQPNAETPAGEFLCNSWVGLFVNGNMLCDLAIRINGGVLLHEVPHKAQADGSRNYAAFEQYLGQKASHGCVRVQRTKNEQGMNMAWLWKNLKKNAKVLIWDDKGRSLPPPDPATPMYYNPDNGKFYHSMARCPGVKDRYLPLRAFTYGELNAPPYDRLTPCATCNPPPRYEGAEAYAPDEADVPDEVLGDISEDASETEQEVDQATYGQ
ncbi:MAG: L,D-transpeptidase [Oscillospiraceae bacterium]|jgi:hypothetical protein|nr:L,D-transpeptidase [Oscillospiraceae bacterium]